MIRRFVIVAGVHSSDACQLGPEGHGYQKSTTYLIVKSTGFYRESNVILIAPLTRAFV